MPASFCALSTEFPRTRHGTGGKDEACVQCGVLRREKGQTSSRRLFCQFSRGLRHFRGRSGVRAHEHRQLATTAATV